VIERVLVGMVGMAGRIIAIGDIHGCADALERLIEAIQPTSDDLLIPLGDYVDRGSDTPRVLDVLIGLDDSCRLLPLLGNHEIMMLQAMNDMSCLRFWLECGGLATMDSYGGPEDIPEAHLEFLSSCRRFAETERFLFVHANYDPNLPLEAQPEQLLFWEHVVHTLPPPHLSGKTAVVGHTPQVSGEILDLGHLICIDTYCVGDGWLTALDVENGTVWQANKAGELRE
jgi:serine/threonine protein phosphatase 1